jgi:hypothetical protein
MMLANTRWVVDSFLAELSSLRLRDIAPAMHVVERRLLLADMVLAEVGEDDLECLAIRAMAECLVSLCWTPTDLEVIGDYLAARQAYLEVLMPYDCGSRRYLAAAVSAAGIAALGAAVQPPKPPPAGFRRFCLDVGVLQS